MTAMEHRLNMQDDIPAPSDGCLQMDNRGGRRHKSHQEPLLGPNLSSHYRERNPSLKAGDTDTAESHQEPLLGPNLSSHYRERNPSLKAGDTDTAVAENSSGTPKMKL
ncbi:uncharacterized protein LOC132559265 [Ylistrum balloti]|uniref:uncharacterized protein LOC132559265 n=1 Tax=Ylistrum balloti TaxID=509963 RepID=UPI002905B7B0|nr:uncharacterized protein LOC132559265 [Ylistrum balloti]